MRPQLPNFFLLSINEHYVCVCVCVFVCVCKCVFCQVHMNNMYTCVLPGTHEQHAYVCHQVHMHKACRICERDHESREALTQHMQQHHAACEMPYSCQLCGYKSCMHSDLVDHFKKVRASFLFLCV